MKYVGKKVEDIKIAYIGGGSRGWAWGLMSDLASCDDMSGRVDLYDIDFERVKYQSHPLDAKREQPIENISVK